MSELSERSIGSSRLTGKVAARNHALDDVDEIVAAGGDATANVDGVTDPNGGPAIVQTALDAHGHVDALIDNAGVVRQALTAQGHGRILRRSKAHRSASR